MTREEIRQEAEKRVNICTPYHTGSFIQGYIAGAEPRENKIADIKANCDLAIEGRDIKIMELEKENAELKEKAKELLNGCIFKARGNVNPSWLELITDIEQFLWEIEK